MCIEKMEQEEASTEEVNRICEKVYELCEKQQKSKSLLREVLNKLEKGSAISLTMGAALRGQQESEKREIETHIIIGEKMENRRSEETQVSMKLSLKTPTLRTPFNAELHANGKIQRPSQKWNVDELLKEDITSKILIQGDYGFKGEEKKDIKTIIHALRSDKQVEFVKRTVEYERCSKFESEGRTLTRDCKETRHHAGSLDIVKAKLSLPKSIVESRITELATEAAKIYYLPYLTQRNIEKRESRQEEEEFDIEAAVDGRGHALTVKISGNGEEVEVRDVRLTSATKGLLPICTRYNLGTKIMQKLTNFNAPSTCTLEAGKVNTFDRYEYDYSLNDCEHIIFTESSSRPRITVSSKETPQKQEVIMVVDGHKYAVEIKKQSRYSRDNKAVIKVNGEVKEWRTLEQQQQHRYPIRQQQQQLQGQQHQLLQQQQQFQQQHQQLQLQQQQLQQQQQQQQKRSYETETYNVYDDEDTYVTNSEDGVYFIVSKKYGVSVQADGKRMEVSSYQHILRNKATGLCGDLNGERTADIKSSKKCLLSEPKLSALSFMVEDGKCRGIPREEKAELEREEEKCVRKEEIPTKVSSIFRSELETKRQPELMHITEETRGTRGETCFSKELVRVCSRSYPKEIRAKQVEFTCKSGVKVEALKRRAGAGELIGELKKSPTRFVQTIYEPKQC